jgi:hypothetical protein
MNSHTGNPSVTTCIPPVQQVAADRTAGPVLARVAARVQERLAREAAEPDSISAGHSASIPH